MIKICETCGVSFPKPYNCSKKSWEKTRFCSRKCKQLWMRTIIGENHPSWKGGFINKAGYRILKRDARVIPEHRYIMEKHLNRKLEKTESVHHINGNKSDNNIDNLIILTKCEHGKLHYPNGSLFGSNNGKQEIMTSEEKIIKRREYARNYQNTHRESYRKYQREYQRKLRAIKKN